MENHGSQFSPSSLLAAGCCQGDPDGGKIWVVKIPFERAKRRVKENFSIFLYSLLFSWWGNRCFENILDTCARGAAEYECSFWFFRSVHRVLFSLLTKRAVWFLFLGWCFLYLPALSEVEIWFFLFKLSCATRLPFYKLSGENFEQDEKQFNLHK